MHRVLDDESFATLVKQCAGYINMRPLSEPSLDPNDPRPLTPADFLLTGSRYLELLPTTEDEDCTLVSHARHMREALKTLKQAYFEEYLATMVKFPKETKSSPHQYAVGDFVHLLHHGQAKETNQKTFAGETKSLFGRYKLGRIKQIHPGVDGHERVFLVDVGQKEWKKVSYMNISPLFI